MRNNRHAVWTTVGVGLVIFALAAVQHVAARVLPEKSTYLTFNRSVRLPGVTLSGGTYIFEMVDPFGSPGVVRVASRDRKVAYFMGLTQAVERPRGLRVDVSVSVGEAPAGTAPPITAWWPVGERTGRKFIYRDR